jgi:hypothetical protein
MLRELIQINEESAPDLSRMWEAVAKREQTSKA